MLYSTTAGAILLCLCLTIPYCLYKTKSREEFFNMFGDSDLHINIANPGKLASLATFIISIIATTLILVPYTIKRPEMLAALAPSYFLVGIFYIAYLTLLLSKK